MNVREDERVSFIGDFDKTRQVDLHFAFGKRLCIFVRDLFGNGLIGCECKLAFEWKLTGLLLDVSGETFCHVLV